MPVENSVGTGLWRGSVYKIRTQKKKREYRGWSGIPVRKKVREAVSRLVQVFRIPVSQLMQFHSNNAQRLAPGAVYGV
jgi:hypothetical protein